jgi:hypothetical protein
MNFLKLNHFLKLIKRILKKKTHSQRDVSAHGHGTWHADISVTPAGGVGFADVNNGPVDVSVASRSMVNASRPPVHRSVVPLVSLT